MLPGMTVRLWRCLRVIDSSEATENSVAWLLAPRNDGGGVGVLRPRMTAEIVEVQRRHARISNNPDRSRETAPTG
jgi:hypothetical protein